MYNFLFMAHSGWRWIVLILIVVVTLKMLMGWLGKQQWTSLDKNLMLVASNAVYIQVALGIVLYILFIVEGGRGRSVGGFTGSHVAPALLAFAGVAFAANRSKKVSGDTNKFKLASIGLLAAIIFVYGALVAVGGVFA